MCGEKETVMTHIDYESPYHVIFLCKLHYRAMQQERREGRKDAHC